MKICSECAKKENINIKNLKYEAGACDKCGKRQYVVEITDTIRPPEELKDLFNL